MNDDVTREAIEADRAAEAVIVWWAKELERHGVDRQHPEVPDSSLQHLFEQLTPALRKHGAAFVSALVQHGAMLLRLQAQLRDLSLEEAVQRYRTAGTLSHLDPDVTDSDD